ncbi:unnamed protein product, partial [Tetraodon nigroviridis]
AVSVVSGTFRSRALWHFGQMIECVQPGINALRYNEYGCWCGVGGSGTPVDDVDRCCRTHDKCYEASREVPGCAEILPYIIDYEFTCSNQQVTCSAINDPCEATVCECDRVAAHCFAQYPYNPEYKNLDPQYCR